MKRDALRILALSAENSLCGAATLAASLHQPIGGYHDAVEPVHPAAALGSADQPYIRSGRFRIDVSNIELLKPERVGHFFFVVHDFLCRKARKLKTTIFAVATLNRHPKITIAPRVATAPHSRKLLDTVVPGLGTYSEKTGSGVMHLHTWEIVLLVLWVAFSPVVGISIGQFFRWCDQ